MRHAGEGNQNVFLHIIASVTWRIAASFIYRLYVLPSSLIALWGLVLLGVSLLQFGNSGASLITILDSLGVTSISLTNDDFVRFIKKGTIVIVTFFTILELLFRKAIDYRAVERKIRFWILTLSWSLGALFLYITNVMSGEIWVVALFFIALGWVLLGIEVVLIKVWKVLRELLEGKRKINLVTTHK
jgi:hypothetical protein